jgi:hypothetical protein
VKISGVKFRFKKGMTELRVRGQILVLLPFLFLSTIHATDSTISGTANGPNGSDDNWNNAANWDNGIPTGAMNAIISTGIHAQEDDSATPAYSGNLWLKTNSILSQKDSTGDILGNGNLILDEGADARFGYNGTFSIGNITLLGNAAISGGWSTVGHHDQRNFNQPISGNYTLTFKGVNNNKAHLNAINSFAEFIADPFQSQDFQVYANSAGSLGNGNVTIGDKVTLFILADNVMSDAAHLHLNGDDSSKVSSEKLDMDNADTIGALWIDGFQMISGNYTNTEDWFDGSGTLTVLSDPPAEAPTVTSIVDDVEGGPIYEDFAEVNFTVTFSLDIDVGTITAADFENGGTASVAIGTVTQTALNEFSVQVVPSSTGNLVFQIKSGAVIQTPIGGSLDTSSAILDDTEIIIDAGSSPEVTITGTSNGPGGSDDEWNLATNWSTNIIPFGTYHARIGDGITVGDDNSSPTTPNYSGNLTIGTGSRMNISDVSQNSLGNGNVIFYEGSTLYTGGSAVTFRDVTLLGNATINSASNSGHHDDKVFSNSITGSFQLTFEGSNNQDWDLNVANSFAVLVANPGQANGYRVRATVASSLGTSAATISINDSVSLWVRADDVMHDDTILNLNGAKSDKSTDKAKVHMENNDTIKALYVDGVQQVAGTWGSTGSTAENQDDTFFNSADSGVLTVLEPIIVSGTIFRVN